MLLEARGLTKRFGALTAVDGVALGVEPGQCTGLLGPNGAGKSTTVAMLVGLVAPDAGQVLIDGAPLAGDTDAKKARVGLVPQDLALYEELAASDNLAVFGALYGLRGADLERAARDALTLVGLYDRRGDKVKTWSGGMKRRLNLAAALMHDPALLILDEPTVGVDPQSRNAIFDNLEALRARAARASSIRRTTWRKPSACASASSSWTTARCSPTTRSRACARACRPPRSRSPRSS